MVNKQVIQIDILLPHVIGLFKLTHLWSAPKAYLHFFQKHIYSQLLSPELFFLQFYYITLVILTLPVYYFNSIQHSRFSCLCEKRLLHKVICCRCFFPSMFCGAACNWCTQWNSVVDSLFASQPAISEINTYWHGRAWDGQAFCCHAVLMCWRWKIPRRSRGILGHQLLW